MGRLRTFECPSCAGRFEQYVHRADEPPPRFCGQCGFDSLTLDASLASPHIATGAAKNVDGVHRAMEEGAEWRANKVQESFGGTTAEGNNLKLTDMRDNARAGETAAVPVVNDVTRMMATVQSQGGPRVGHVSADQALQYSGQVMAGPTPNAGVRAARSLKALHGSQGGVVTHAPAMETLSPLYQRRI